MRFAGESLTTIACESLDSSKCAAVCTCILYLGICFQQMGHSVNLLSDSSLEGDDMTAFCKAGRSDRRLDARLLLLHAIQYENTG